MYKLHLIAQLRTTLAHAYKEAQARGRASEAFETACAWQLYASGWTDRTASCFQQRADTLVNLGRSVEAGSVHDERAQQEVDFAAAVSAARAAGRQADRPTIAQSQALAGVVLDIGSLALNGTTSLERDEWAAALQGFMAAEVTAAPHAAGLTPIPAIVSSLVADVRRHAYADGRQGMLAHLGANITSLASQVARLEGRPYVPAEQHALASVYSDAHSETELMGTGVRLASTVESAVKPWRPPQKQARSVKPSAEPTAAEELHLARASLRAYTTLREAIISARDELFESPPTVVVQAPPTAELAADTGLPTPAQSAAAHSTTDLHQPVSAWYGVVMQTLVQRVPSRVWTMGVAALIITCFALLFTSTPPVDELEPAAPAPHPVVTGLSSGGCPFSSRKADSFCASTTAAVISSSARESRKSQPALAILVTALTAPGEPPPVDRAATAVHALVAITLEGSLDDSPQQEPLMTTTSRKRMRKHKGGKKRPAEVLTPTDTGENGAPSLIATAPIAVATAAPDLQLSDLQSGVADEAWELIGSTNRTKMASPAAAAVPPSQATGGAAAATQSPRTPAELTPVIATPCNASPRVTEQPALHQPTAKEVEAPVLSCSKKAATPLSKEVVTMSARELEKALKKRGKRPAERRGPMKRTRGDPVAQPPAAGLATRGGGCTRARGSICTMASETTSEGDPSEVLASSRAAAVWVSRDSSGSASVLSHETTRSDPCRLTGACARISACSRASSDALSTSCDSVDTATEGGLDDAFVTDTFVRKDAPRDSYSEPQAEASLGIAATLETSVQGSPERAISGFGAADNKDPKMSEALAPPEASAEHQRSSAPSSFEYGHPGAEQALPDFERQMQNLRFLPSVPAVPPRQILEAHPQTMASRPLVAASNSPVQQLPLSQQNASSLQAPVTARVCPPFAVPPVALPPGIYVPPGAQVGMGGSGTVDMMYAGCMYQLGVGAGGFGWYRVA